MKRIFLYTIVLAFGLLCSCDDDDSFSMYYAHMNVGDETITLDEQMFLELVYTPFATYSEEVLGKELEEDVQDAFEQIYESIY